VTKREKSIRSICEASYKCIGVEPGDSEGGMMTSVGASGRDRVCHEAISTSDDHDGGTASILLLHAMRWPAQEV